MPQVLVVTSQALEGTRKMDPVRPGIILASLNVFQQEKTDQRKKTTETRGQLGARGTQGKKTLDILCKYLTLKP